MVQSGQPNAVWDPKGAIEFSANGLNTAAPGNTEYGLMGFNTASIVSLLNSTYGTGGWAITGVSVSLSANFATAGRYPNNSVFNEIEPGTFTLSWLSNNGWVSSQSGGVTWNNLSNYVPGMGGNLEEAEGTFYWAADGVHGVDGSPESYALTPTSDLLSDIANGGYVSIIGTPADSEVGYLSNTPTAGQCGEARRDRPSCPGAAVGGAHVDRPRNHHDGLVAPGTPNECPRRCRKCRHRGSGFLRGEQFHESYLVSSLEQ